MRNQKRFLSSSTNNNVKVSSNMWFFYLKIKEFDLKNICYLGFLRYFLDISQHELTPFQTNFRWWRFRCVSARGQCCRLWAIATPRCSPSWWFDYKTFLHQRLGRTTLMCTNDWFASLVDTQINSVSACELKEMFLNQWTPSITL